MSDFEEDDLRIHGDESDEGTMDDGHDEDSTSEKQRRVTPCELTQDMIKEGLSLLCRTGTGLSHAFVKLELVDRRLTSITRLENLVHLRFLDLTGNCLSDLTPLMALTQLLWLKVDGNLIQNVADQKLESLIYLQWLSLAKNHIRDVEGFSVASVETLNLIGNGIQTMVGLECHKLSNLVTLELRGNRLETTEGLNLPNLRRLYMAQNVIRHLDGLEKLERLTTLHLRDNQLETLDGIGPGMKSLQYLNVRGNLIYTRSALRNLAGVAQSLRALVLSENPIMETDEYRVFVLTLLPLLERLDKESVSEEEKADAHERQKEFEEDESQANGN